MARAPVASTRGACRSPGEPAIRALAAHALRRQVNGFTSRIGWFTGEVIDQQLEAVYE